MPSTGSYVVCHTDLFACPLITAAEVLIVRRVRYAGEQVGVHQAEKPPGAVQLHPGAVQLRQMGEFSTAVVPYPAIPRTKSVAPEMSHWAERSTSFIIVSGASIGMERHQIEDAGGIR